VLLFGGLVRVAQAVALSAVEGTIVDAQEHPIEDASVTLRGLRGGVHRTRSDGQGIFRFPAAAVGEVYILEVDADGFRGIAYDGFRLEANRPSRFAVRLKHPGEREVAVFLSRDPYPFDDLLRGFLQDLGVPARVFDLDREENPGELVRRVRAERPNLVVGSGLLAARLVRRDIPDVPAILSLLGDPRLHDLEAVNLAYLPMNAPPEEAIARLRAVLPSARRLGLLFDARDASLVARDLGSEARRAGLSVISQPCYSVTKLPEALAHLHNRIDSLIVPFDPLSNESAALDEITHWALQEKVALVAPGPEWVKRGALFCYGPTSETLGRELSRLAGQVLFQGQQASQLSAHARTTPFFAVNATTALALGIQLPENVIVDAKY
jgi:ABC-type uncharacterized transport system substrate-binding protein